MARTRGGNAEQTVEQTVEQAPAAEPVVDEQAEQVAELPEGEFDVEAWVAAVYDYQHNGGPKPERTYRVAPAEPVHVDATGTVTPVERASADEDDAEVESAEA